jgi:hypothetical protein
MSYKKNYKFILILCFYSSLYANEINVDKTVIAQAFPSLNEYQIEEILNQIHKTNDKLADNFKNLQLNPTYCKMNTTYNKFICRSKNDSDHLNKEQNHFYGYQNSYGFQFTLSLMQAIKLDRSNFTNEKPRFLIEQSFWNNRIETDVYQGNELIHLD